MQDITLVTGNPNKAREVAKILGFDIRTQAFDIPEIQSFELEEIVRAKVGEAFRQAQSPVLVEDVSFELASLNGFPGPFIKFWDQRGGHELDAVIGKALGNDRVRIRSGIGYADKDRILYVESCVEGRVVARTDGEGWGLDFYFVPDGYDRSFAQLGPEEKNKTSHRALAFLEMKRQLETIR